MDLGGSGETLDQSGIARHQVTTGESTAGPELMSAGGQVRLIEGFGSALIVMPVPEPSEWLQLMSGLVGLIGLNRMHQGRLSEQAHVEQTRDTERAQRALGDRHAGE